MESSASVLRRNVPFRLSRSTHSYEQGRRFTGGLVCFEAARTSFFASRAACPCGFVAAQSSAIPDQPVEHSHDFMEIPHTMCVFADCGKAPQKHSFQRKTIALCPKKHYYGDLVYNRVDACGAVNARERYALYLLFFWRQHHGTSLTSVRCSRGFTVYRLLLLCFTALAVFLGPFGSSGQVFAATDARAAPHDRVLLEKTSASDLPGTPVEVLSLRYASPRVAIVTPDRLRLILGLNRDLDSQEKKFSPLLAGKGFKPFRVQLILGRMYFFSIAFPATSKYHEQFPFDPRSPCLLG